MSSVQLSNSEAERLRAFERQGHDALAKTYHAFFAPVTALATQLLFDAVRLGPGTRLLDIATGPGALAAEAANRGARPVGIDLSPQMIDLARRLHPGIDFREADVEHLPFGDDTFDAVVCAFGLGHFPGPEAAVAESVRTLLPGGRIAFSWWDDPSRQRIQGIFRDAIADVGVSVPPDVPQGHMCTVSPTRESSCGCWREPDSSRWQSRSTRRPISSPIRKPFGEVAWAASF
jgi:SAM-dependent methyltransferase